MATTAMAANGMSFGLFMASPKYRGDATSRIIAISPAREPKSRAASLPMYRTPIQPKTLLTRCRRTDGSAAEILVESAQRRSNSPPYTNMSLNVSAERSVKPDAKYRYTSSPYS